MGGALLSLDAIAVCSIRALCSCVALFFLAVVQELRREAARLEQQVPLGLFELHVPCCLLKTYLLLFIVLADQNDDARSLASMASSRN